MRSITDGNAPSTTELAMMSAQTGGNQVEMLKSPAVHTAHKTCPTTALSTNDAARAVTRNTNSINIAYVTRERCTFFRGCGAPGCLISVVPG